MVKARTALIGTKGDGVGIDRAMWQWVTGSDEDASNHDTGTSDAGFFSAVHQYGPQMTSIMPFLGADGALMADKNSSCFRSI